METEELAKTLSGLGDLGQTIPAPASTTPPVSLPFLSLTIGREGEGGARPTTTPDLVVGGVLGEGGMGVVVLAHQRSLGRDVAIKRVRDATDAGAVAALLTEAAVTGGLEHPSIVPVHALGRDERGFPLMVMKRLDGVTLRALVADPTHPRWAELGDDRIGFFVAVARRLCDALAFAARRGVVHRDVKPDNVMVGDFGEVYLLDWGVATKAGEPLPASAIAGTPVYMAPEMLRPASGDIDARCDVYLLGATLHECLTGKPPHAGTTVLAVLLAAAESAPHEYGPNIPPELADIVRRAMHREREERYADARALGRALDGFLAHRAAAALADAATDRLRAMVEAIDGKSDTPKSDVHALFYECRFGFEQALRAWPENERARAGLRSANEHMCGHSIAQGDRATAAALLAALAPPPAALVERLAVLDRDLAAREAERQRLRAIVHDHDLTVGADERRIGVRAAAVTMTVLALGIIALFSAGAVQLDTRLVFLLTLPPLVAVVAVLWRWRARLLANRVSRQMGLTLLFMIGSVALHRISGLSHATPLADVASGDAFLVAAVAAVSALTLRRLYFVPAALFAAAGFAAPPLGVFAFVPMFIAAAASVALVIASPRALRAPALGAAIGAERP